jgi:hypothetical protein
VVLIEWPERAGEGEPIDDLRLRLHLKPPPGAAPETLAAGDQEASAASDPRWIELQAHSESARRLLGELETTELESTEVPGHV